MKIIRLPHTVLKGNFQGISGITFTIDFFAIFKLRAKKNLSELMLMPSLIARLKRIYELGHYQFL